MATAGSTPPGEHPTAAGAPTALGPTPPPTATLAPTPPPAEAASPFSAKELIQLGNALSRLSAKCPARFIEVYQEQLSLVLPRLSAEECEEVCPTLAVSQLMHDPLRRTFLERCAQVDAGRPIPVWEGDHGAAPEIGAYQKEEARRQRRLKHFRNIYAIEASVRKETFSFFTSLPAEVKTYLDKLHAESAQLPHEGQSAFAQQVAGVLDQLGVSCDLSRMSGPLSLHVVVKSPNPRVDIGQMIYECSDTSDFYVVKHDKKDVAQELTALTKFRHKLLQRLGVTLVHIDIFEWKQMGEAQRVNFMVKQQQVLQQ